VSSKRQYIPSVRVKKEERQEGLDTTWIQTSPKFKSVVEVAVTALIMMMEATGP
jgi:hypothetical protein